MKGAGVACHGIVVECLDFCVRVAGRHVVKGWFTVNRLGLYSVRFSFQYHVVDFGIVNILRRIRQGACRLLGKTAGPAERQDAIIMSVNFHGSSKMINT